MGTRSSNTVSRRSILKLGAGAMAGAFPMAFVPRRSRAQQRQLKILQWKHFVPGYDQWFNETYIKQWGEENDVEVIVENVGVADVSQRAMEDVAAQGGHDIVQFVVPTTLLEDHVIDHRNIYEECERRYGKVADFILKSTYNPRTDKYFGVCHAYSPSFIIYRGNLWDAVQSTPDSWESIRTGGRRIKLLHEKPVGFSLAGEHNGESTLRAILYSFGGSEQDAAGRVALKSDATLEAIHYVKALFEEAMTEEVLGWDAASNNRFMVNGEGSLTLDTLSIPRASEKMTDSPAADLRLAGIPRGPAASIGPGFGYYTSAIWNFAEHIETAEKFLLDYMGQLREAFLASEFQNMPSVSAAVPNLAALLSDDPAGGPPGRYAVLAGGEGWSTNLGHPGHTNTAIMDVMNEGILARMFATAATGEATPEEALETADAEVSAIFQKWRERGKV